MLLPQCSSWHKVNYQILLTDFGKAIKSSYGKSLYLTQKEKREYIQKFPQIPPEVIEKESTICY